MGVFAHAQTVDTRPFFRVCKRPGYEARLVCGKNITVLKAHSLNRNIHGSNRAKVPAWMKIYHHMCSAEGLSG